MKYLALILFLSNSFALSALDIAKSKDIPGKFCNGDCLVFAKELNHRLNVAGYTSYLITYKWQTYYPNRYGYHAVVLFQDSTKWFIMDNIVWKPVRVSGKNERECLYIFTGVEILITEIEIKINL